jgi:MFS family permease
VTEQNQEQQKTGRDSSIAYDGEDLERDSYIGEFESVGIEEDRSFITSLREIFQRKNYTVYLVTSWIYIAGTTIWSYLNLYLRALNWDYLLIGVVMTLSGVLTAVFRFVGGYIGDTSDRKSLAVISMFLIGIYSFIIGVFVDVWMITLGIAILASAELTKSGSSAYIMENISKENSGLALSLFTSGRAFGIITLLVFGAIIPFYGFGESIRLIYYINGVLIIISTIIRAAFLESSKTRNDRNGERILRDFANKNTETIRILVKTIPGIIIVMFIDGLSDSIFKFGALIYTNETVGIDIAGINIILLTTLILMVPLLLKVGRVTDRVGIQRAAVLVYSIMPIAAFLLFIASSYTYWAPMSLVDSANAAYTGLGVVFSLPFLGLIMKNINDQLWWLVLLALIRKKLPKKDTSKILAVLMTVAYLCASIGPLIGGLLFEILPQQWLFLIVIALNMIIILILAGSGITEDTKTIHVNGSE